MKPRFASAWAVILVTPLLFVLQAWAQERLPSDRFGDVKLFRPSAPSDNPQFVVFFPDLAAHKSPPPLISTLTSAGAHVALMDTVAFEKTLQDSGGSCLPLWEFARFTQVLEGMAKMKKFVDPVVIGEGEGASLSYLLLGALSDTFKAGASIGFCGTMHISVQLCEEGEPHLADQIGPTLTELKAGLELTAPWDIVIRDGGEKCSTLVARQFAAQTKGAKLHHVKQTNTASLDGEYAFLRAELDEPPLPAPGTASQIKEVADLPLVELKPDNLLQKYFVVLISGDGGWASLDKDLGEYFEQKGIGVVGLDSLSYFWKAKTPEQTTQDITRIITSYQAEWSIDHVVLMGYSLGANIVPFVINRLPNEQRTNVIATVLLNPGEKTSFEVHMTDWLNMSDLEQGQDILPEAKRISPSKFLCVYGEEEDDSLCPKLAGQAELEKLAGGHHFDGDYEALGAKILKFIERPVEGSAVPK